MWDHRILSLSMFPIFRPRCWCAGQPVVTSADFPWAPRFCCPRSQCPLTLPTGETLPPLKAQESSKIEFKNNRTPLCAHTRRHTSPWNL